MSGCHHNHAHTTSHVRLIAVLTGLLFLLELLGAWKTQSLGLFSDAVHVFSDLAGLLITLVSLWLSERPADKRRTFGYYRFEILSACVNAVLLLGVSGFILYEAYVRVFFAPQSVHADGMLAVALVGLLVNLFGAWRLHQHSKTNLGLKAAYLDLMADAISSVGVVIASVLMLWFGWSWVDPLVAVLIAVWILPRVWNLMGQSVNILLEGVPEGIDLQAIQSTLMRQPGVASVHDLHVWAIGSGKISLTAHITLSDSATDRFQETLRAVETTLRQTYQITHTTIQLESPGNDPHACAWPDNALPAPHGHTH
jgi:cobalt-zinc-cadmium efflux system protein